MHHARCLSMLPVFAIASLLTLAGCVADSDSAAPDDAQTEAENVATIEEGVTANVWNFVCAQSLTLRDQPGGKVIGTMYNTAYHADSWFYPVSFSNGWAYGFSYSLNRWGWTMNYYLSTSYDVDHTPSGGTSWWCLQNEPHGPGIGGDF